MFQNYRHFKQTKACTTARHKTLLYSSLILSHVNYCITVWGYKRSRILRIKKKAIRKITLNRYNSHTEPLFKTLQTSYLLNLNVIPNYNIHGHDTRKATNILTSVTRHQFAKKCLKYSLPHIINDTPELVLEIIVTVYMGLRITL